MPVPIPDAVSDYRELEGYIREAAEDFGLDNSKPFPYRVFTHRTTNVHMHFKTKDKSLAGHIDDLKPGENMMLKLPIR